MKSLFLALVGVVAAKHTSKIDINQKVYIEGNPVLGDGAGEDGLGQCKAFASSHVSNVDGPTVKNCGTGIKTTVYMRNDCVENHHHQSVIGKCDTGAPASTCDTLSPAQQPTMGHYQSYKIEQC